MPSMPLPRKRKGQFLKIVPQADNTSLRFNIFVLCSLLSRAGDNLVEFGLTLILLERFPGQLTPALGFGIARGLVVLLLGGRLGALFDRHRPRQVLVLSVVLQVVSLLAFAAVMMQPTPQAWPFWLCGMLMSLGGFLFETGFTYSFLPLLGESEQLTRFNALFHSVNQVGQVVGPAVAGLIYSLWGGVGILVADILTFVAELLGLSLAPLLAERAIKKSSPQETAPAATSFVGSLRAYHPALPWLVLAVGLAWCNGISPYSTAFNFFLIEHMKLSVSELGWVRASSAILAIVGAALTPWLVRRLGGSGPVMMLGAMAEALSLIGCAIWRNSFVLLMFWLGISRFALSIFLLAATNLRQTLIPVEARGVANGRINGFFRGMGLSNMLLQTLLDSSERSYTLLAWGTAGFLSLSAASAARASRWLHHRRA